MESQAVVDAEELVRGQQGTCHSEHTKVMSRLHSATSQALDVVVKQHLTVLAGPVAR